MPYTTTVPNLLVWAIGVMNGVIVPVIFAVAFLMFLVGVYRYFIASQGNPEKVQEGQKFVMWSLIGFFIMFSIWGLVNLLVNTLGFNYSIMPNIPTFGPGTSAPYYAGPGSSGGLNGGSGTSAGSGLNGGSGTSAGTLGNGSVGNGGSCAGNPNACQNGYICSSSNTCVVIPANGTMSNGQSCLGNVNACTNGLTCATQSGDVCLPSSNSGNSNTVQCSDGTTADTQADCQ